MPAVPTAPLPSLEVKPQNAPNYTPEDFGAGTGRAMMQVGQTLQNSGELIAKHVEERMARDNDTKVLEATAKIHTAYRDANYGENGFFTRRGENAVGTTAEAQKRFEEINRSVAAEYKSNPVVAAKVQQAATRLASSTLDSLKPHEENQRIAAADNASDALVKSSSIDAANAAVGPDGNPDPAIIQRSVNTARAAVLKIAKDRGENEEAARLRILNADSAVHSAVVDRLLATDPLKAAAYYQANAGGINGSDHARLQASIKEKTNAYQDDADTQRITGQSAGVQKLAGSIAAIDVPSTADYVKTNLPTAGAPGAPAAAAGGQENVFGAALGMLPKDGSTPAAADPAGKPIDIAPGGKIAGSRASAAAVSPAVAAIAPSVEHGETGGSKPGAISATGAAGVMQVQPATAIDISTKILKDGVFPPGTPDAKIQEALSTNKDLARRYGTAYLQHLSDRYHGDVEAVLVGYNAGPGNADKWLRAGRDYSVLPKPHETEPYVSKVLSHFTGATGGAAGVQERAGANMPPLGQKMTKENWSLSFYKPEDILAPTAGGQQVDARAATMADILGKTFFDKTGIRIAINDTNGGPGTAGKRRGVADPADNPHAEHSEHLASNGRAFDFQIQNLTPDQKAEFLRTARSIGFTGVGFYDKGDKAGHLHLDIGRPRSWGDVPGWAQGAMATSAPPIGSFGISGVTTRNDARPYQVYSMPGTVPTNAPSGGVTGAPTFASMPAGIPGATPDASVGGVGAPAATAEPVPPSPVPALPTTTTSERPTPALLAQWEAEAQAIADPTRRASVLAKVRAEYARRLQLHEQGQKAAYEDAFGKVVAGKLDPRQIPAGQLQAMGPEKASSILEWHDKMKKAGEPDQDWKTWAEISQMPDAQLAQKSLFDYRTKLDNAHFDKLTERYKAIQTKSDDAVEHLKGVRDRNELVKGAMAELAGTTKINDWEKRPENMVLMGQLNSRLDDEIASYIRTNKKPPDAEWQKKTLDRLMVKVATSGGFLGMGGSTTRAFQVEPETAEKQVAPEDTIKTYKDVPVSDRVSVKNMWTEGAGKAPTEKELVDVYAQIVRARMNVPQISDPPVHEKTEIVNALKKRLGKDPDTKQIREFWSRILLDKFGGK